MCQTPPRLLNNIDKQDTGTLNPIKAHYFLGKKT